VSAALRDLKKVADIIGPVETHCKKRRCFPRARVVSPERTAGQTACPEELPARAGNICGQKGN
jgi:hypothetical protein